MLRIDLLRGLTPELGGIRDKVVPKAVAAEGHRHVVQAETLPDDDVRHGRCALQGLVRDLLHRHDLATAQRSVRRDQRLRLRVRKARCNCGCGEAGEDRHLHSTEVRARVRRDRHLRRHGQEDADGVSRPDPDRRQPLGEAVDRVRKLPPGERDAQPVLGLPDGRLLLGELAGRPAVDAVPGEVQLRADEPPRPFRAVRGVDDLCPRLRELEAQILDQRRPEALGLLDRDAMEVAVALDPEPPRQPGHVGALDLLRRRRPDELGHARSVRGSLTCRR